MELNQIHIGTSGWHYARWRGPFYPRDLPVKKFLEYYTASFSTVEINNTFYLLPKKETMANWRDTAPEGFFFAVKASRFITPMKKLKDPEKSLAPFLEGGEILWKNWVPFSFYLFAIAVNADRVARTLVQLKKVLRKSGLNLSLGFEITMPSNYIP